MIYISSTIETEIYCMGYMETAKCFSFSRSDNARNLEKELSTPSQTDCSI